MIKQAIEERPWLKYYDPHVPPTLDYPRTTLPESLAQVARKFPDHPAWIFKGNKISYQSYNQAVDRMAAALQGLGIKKGDRVAIHLPNCPQFPICYYAILRIGGIIVPCNPVYTSRELAYQLKDSGAETIITLSLTFNLVKAVNVEVPLQHILVTRIKTYFPPFLRLLFTLFREEKSGHRADITSMKNALWYEDLLAKSPEKPNPVDLNWEDIAVLLYTGGTTGVSKAAILTHKNILVNAYQAVVWVDTTDQKDSSLVALPLFHSYGMTCAMNGGALMALTGILVPDPRDINDILESIQKYKPTLYPGVPAMYAAINNNPKVKDYDLRSIKICNSGAAPLPIEVQKRFQEITGGRLVEGYGLSEASPVTHSNPAIKNDRIGTVGLPWPDTEARIVDADTGAHVLAAGEVGELCIRGPQVMRGYWNMPTETANALRSDPTGGEPWLYTGDLAVMDEQGYFRIVDRKKDMILGAGGYNIYPREVEEVLFEHPAVLDAAAVGIFMGEKGERVKAYVVLKPGASATQEEIISFCKERLAPYKVPREVEFRDSLPKTQVGKVLRRMLVEESRMAVKSTD